MRKIIFAAAPLLALAACNTTPAKIAATPVPTSVNTSAARALQYEQEAVGIAQVVLPLTNLPQAVKDKINADLAVIQPLVVAGLTDAASAQTVADVATDIVALAGPYFHVSPSTH